MKNINNQINYSDTIQDLGINRVLAQFKDIYFYHKELYNCNSEIQLSEWELGLQNYFNFEVLTSKYNRLKYKIIVSEDQTAFITMNLNSNLLFSFEFYGFTIADARGFIISFLQKELMKIYTWINSIRRDLLNQQKVNHLKNIEQLLAELTRLQAFPAEYPISFLN